MSFLKNVPQKEIPIPNARRAVLLTVALTAAIGLSYLTFIRLTGFSLPCFFYEVTGIKCAGCGITRMALALSQFEIARAFFYNPIVFSLLSLWSIVSVFLLVGRPVFLRRTRTLYALLAVTVVSTVIFALVRLFIS